MGDPSGAPVIHITGTNGKGSTAQIITRLLVAQGLTVGTYTSPHLERVNERLSRNGEPISDEDLAEQIGAVADLEVLAGVEPSYFEIVTAAAFRWFADIAVDVMVVEVGLLGRWDATNVVDAQVPVVTNVGLDHLEYAGPTLADIAAEKAGIIKPGAPWSWARPIPSWRHLPRRGARRVIERRRTSTCWTTSWPSAGGCSRCGRRRRSTPTCSSAPRPHQGDNAARRAHRRRGVLRRPLPEEVVEEGFAAVRMPGRVRGDGASAAGDRRRRAQPARRRQLCAGAVRRLRPGRPADPRGGLPRATRRRCSRPCGPTSSTP